MHTVPTPHPGRANDAGLPPQVRLPLSGVALVVLAVVCDAAGLHGASTTVPVPGAALAGSPDPWAAVALLTASAASAVHTGSVTGHDGVLGPGDGRWRELVPVAAAARLACPAGCLGRAAVRR